MKNVVIDGEHHVLLTKEEHQNLTKETAKEQSSDLIKAGDKVRCTSLEGFKSDGELANGFLGVKPEFMKEDGLVIGNVYVVAKSASKYGRDQEQGIDLVSPNGSYTHPVSSFVKVSSDTPVDETKAGESSAKNSADRLMKMLFAHALLSHLSDKLDKNDGE